MNVVAEELLFGDLFNFNEVWDKNQFIFSHTYKLSTLRDKGLLAFCYILLCYPLEIKILLNYY